MHKDLADIDAAEGWLMTSRGFSVKIRPSHSLAEAFARHRIAALADAQRQVVAYAYERFDPDGRRFAHIEWADHRRPPFNGYTETPLYTHPPAQDVEALVSLLKDANDLLLNLGGNPEHEFRKRVDEALTNRSKP